jgi:hypothetical protein
MAATRADPDFRNTFAFMSPVDGFRPMVHRQMIWKGMLRCSQKAKNAAAAQVATTPACNHACDDCARCRQ